MVFTSVGAVDGVRVVVTNSCSEVMLVAVMVLKFRMVVCWRCSYGAWRWQCWFVPEGNVVVVVVVCGVVVVDVVVMATVVIIVDIEDCSIGGRFGDFFFFRGLWLWSSRLVVVLVAVFEMTILLREIVEVVLATVISAMMQLVAVLRSWSQVLVATNDLIVCNQ